MASPLSKAAVLIRPIQQDDFMAWQRLWEDYNAIGQSEVVALSENAMEITWNRFFREHEPTEALVAELDGSLEAVMD